MAQPNSQSHSPDALRRAADPILFSTAYIVEMSAEVTSGTLTSDDFTRLTTNFFVAIQNAPGALAQKMARIYDASRAARPRLHRAAKSIRTLRRQSTEALLSRRRKEEFIFE